VRDLVRVGKGLKFELGTSDEEGNLDCEGLLFLNI
jgi:hypothetical protein